MKTPKIVSLALSASLALGGLALGAGSALAQDRAPRAYVPRGVVVVQRPAPPAVIRITPPSPLVRVETPAEVRVEARHERRDERRDARHERRDARHERREARRGH